ncbi:MAG: hypothetical protein IJS96_05710 [Schwartzia sp.]|nr:hypothetical protein [Schwartzia sp. (in: firmicutes)]
MTDEEIIRAFHCMWDGFPEPIMMIKKSREIVAANPKAEALGIKVGTKCSSYGKPEQHKGCRANEAADEKKTIAITYPGPFGKDAYGYWIPLPEKPEWMLHFSIGYSMKYEEATNIVVNPPSGKDA